MTDEPTGVRVDSWTWAVRLFKTRSQATAACRAGHVRLNGERAKPASLLHIGDRLRVRTAERERIVVVTRLITKRVGAPVAAQCLIDETPPPPSPVEQALGPRRERGSGRPTKRDRRALERLRRR